MQNLKNESVCLFFFPIMLRIYPQFPYWTDNQPARRILSTKRNFKIIYIRKEGNGQKGQIIGDWYSGCMSRMYTAGHMRCIKWASWVNVGPGPICHDGPTTHAGFYHGSRLSVSPADKLLPQDRTAGIT